MTDAIELVKTFMAEWAKGSEAVHASHHKYFTDTTIWENVGFVTTTGVDEAIAFIRKFEDEMNTWAIEVDMLAIAQVDDKVLTERVDRFLDKAGNEIVSIRVMGILEIEDGKIVRWRDYFDTYPFRDKN